MAEKPILFSAPMVRAILEGRKTQTRRIIMPQPVWQEAGDGLPAGWQWAHKRSTSIYSRYAGLHGSGMSDEELKALLIQILPIAVGDLLWVRESIIVVNETTPNPGSHAGGFWPYYAADKTPVRGEGVNATWRPLRSVPSIHMPRWASRITLRVTAVKVERLHMISRANVLAEGLPIEAIQKWEQWLDKRDAHGAAFGELWNSINGPGSWDRNDWVAAYSFERVKP